MQTLKISIKDNAFDKVMYLLNHLKDDVKILPNDDEPSKEEILKSIKDSMKEVKLIEEGKLKGKSAEDFLNEL